MNKLYIFIFITLLGTTAFISADHKAKKSYPLALENTAPEEMEVAEASLSVKEKSKLFNAHAQEVYTKISGVKPSLEVFNQALKIHHSLLNDGSLNNPELLTIIDFSLPSTEKRLWVINLENLEVLENIVVSHGKNSGLNKVKSFSNTENSFQSSMGAYLTAETYTGKHGLSLRLDGLEEGINDNARKRHIVMHTAAYANPSLIKIQGRLGRSLGCPAIPSDKINLITDISGGSLLFIYGNDEAYVDNTSFKDIDSAFNTLEQEMELI